MDEQLVKQVLNYHGQELYRALEAEQGAEKLKHIDIRNINYYEYHRRIKEISFQERRRRIKLFDFIARKAHILFKPLPLVPTPPDSRNDIDEQEVPAIIPPIEHFMRVPASARVKQFIQTIQRGDYVIGRIIQRPHNVNYTQSFSLHVSLLCTDGRKKRDIHDLDITAQCPFSQIHFTPTENLLTGYKHNDIIRAVVTNVVTKDAKIFVSLKPFMASGEGQKKLKLGSIIDEDLPLYYRKMLSLQNLSYNDLLQHTQSFNNPSIANYLCETLGLSTSKLASLMRGLHNVEFRPEQYAAALRKEQTGKWAFKSVKDGVAHFKAGNYTEAFQCLNKALQLDPGNVEALVARGALFANNNNLRRAIEDFTQALQINKSHNNARKYLFETLLAQGKCFEDDGDLDSASKAYQTASEVNPGSWEARTAFLALEARRQQALLALEAKKQKELEMKNKLSSLLLHPLETPSAEHMAYDIGYADTREKLKQLLREEKMESLTAGSSHPLNTEQPTFAEDPRLHKIENASTSSSSLTSSPPLLSPYHLPQAPPSKWRPIGAAEDYIDQKQYTKHSPTEWDKSISSQSGNTKSGAESVQQLYNNEEDDSKDWKDHASLLKSWGSKEMERVPHIEGWQYQVKADYDSSISPKEGWKYPDMEEPDVHSVLSKQGWKYEDAVEQESDIVPEKVWIHQETEHISGIIMAKQGWQHHDREEHDTDRVPPKHGWKYQSEEEHEMGRVPSKQGWKYDDEAEHEMESVTSMHSWKYEDKAEHRSDRVLPNTQHGWKYQDEAEHEPDRAPKQVYRYQEKIAYKPNTAAPKQGWKYEDRIEYELDRDKTKHRSRHGDKDEHGLERPPTKWGSKQHDREQDPSKRAIKHSSIYQDHKTEYDPYRWSKHGKGTEKKELVAAQSKEQWPHSAKHNEMKTLEGGRRDNRTSQLQHSNKGRDEEEAAVWQAKRKNASQKRLFANKPPGFIEEEDDDDDVLEEMARKCIPKVTFIMRKEEEIHFSKLFTSNTKTTSPSVESTKSESKGNLFPIVSHFSPDDTPRTSSDQQSRHFNRMEIPSKSTKEATNKGHGDMMNRSLPYNYDHNKDYNRWSELKSDELYHGIESPDKKESPPRVPSKRPLGESFRDQKEPKKRKESASGIVSRAPDLEHIRSMQEAVRQRKEPEIEQFKLARVATIKKNKVDMKGSRWGPPSDKMTKAQIMANWSTIEAIPKKPASSALQAALEAARKINESLCDDDNPKPSSQEALPTGDNVKTLEAFLEKLRAEKRAKLLATNMDARKKV